MISPSPVAKADQTSPNQLNPAPALFPSTWRCPHQHPCCPIPLRAAKKCRALLRAELQHLRWPQLVVIFVWLQWVTAYISEALRNTVRISTTQANRGLTVSDVCYLLTLLQNRVAVTSAGQSTACWGPQLLQLHFLILSTSAFYSKVLLSIFDSQFLLQVWGTLTAAQNNKNQTLSREKQPQFCKKSSASVTKNLYLIWLVRGHTRELPLWQLSPWHRMSFIAAKAGCSSPAAWLTPLKTKLRPSFPCFMN